MSRPRYGSSSTFTPSFSTNRSVAVWCIVGTLFRSVRDVENGAGCVASFLNGAAQSPRK